MCDTHLRFDESSKVFHKWYASIILCTYDFCCVAELRLSYVAGLQALQDVGWSYLVRGFSVCFMQYYSLYTIMLPFLVLLPLLLFV